MKRRNKIIATITTISLALTMLVIGVVASTSRTFSITGNIAYIVEDVMCNITTSLFCTDNNILSTDAELYNEMYKLADTALDINSESVSLPSGIVKSARFDAVTKSTYNQITDTYASNEQLNVDNIELVMGKYDSSITASDRESFAYYIVVEIENFATNTISVSITPNVANSSIENLRTMMTSSNFQIQGLETKRVVLAVSIDEITRNVDLSTLNWTVELKNISKPQLQVETIHKNTELADIPLTTQTIDISTEAVTLAGGSGLIAFSIEDIPSGYNNLHLSLTDTNNTIFSECIGVYVETEEQLPTNLEEAGALLDGISDFSKVVIATNISNIYLPSEDVYFFLMLSGFDENLTETTITAEKTLVALATSLTTGADLTIEDCFVDTMMEMPLVLVNCTIENVSANSLTIEVPSAMMMLGAVLPEGTSFPINVAQAYPMLMMSSEESIFQGETSISVPLSSKYADNSISFSFIVAGEFTEESTDISLGASYGEGQTASSSEYTYSLQTINDKQGYVITGYSGIDTNIVVPTYFVDESTNTAYDVIGIGGFGYKNITDIVLPDTLLSISDNAFNHCQQLSSIDIPDNVISIGNNAFRDCKGLQGQLVLPKKLINIGNYAFAYCKGLNDELKLPNSLKTIGNYAFNECREITGELYIPSSVESIGEYAFYYCDKVSNLNILNGVKTIGSYVFAYCSALENITIPSSVTSLASNAFYECLGVKKLNYNANAIYSFTSSNFGSSEGFSAVIGQDGDNVKISTPIFNSNTKLKSLQLNNNVEKIVSKAFWYCNKLTGDLIIPDGVTTIESNAFYNCTKLESITIPSSVITIGDRAFGYCWVKELNYNANTTYSFGTDFGSDGFNVVIGKDGDSVKISTPRFDNNSKLKTLEIKNNVQTISYLSFYRCTGLTGKLVIPSSVQTISNSSFSQCTGLTGNLVIPNGVTTIGNNAFYGCTGIESITIPYSVTSLSSSFTDCLGVKEINYNANVSYAQNEFSYVGSSEGIRVVLGKHDYNKQISIPKRLFYANTNIKTLYINNNVTSINEEAFYKCSKLAGDLIIPDSVTNIGYSAFYECSELESLNLSEKLNNIGYQAFYKCSKLAGDLIIPDSVTNIGYSAFYECSSLEGLTLSKGLTKLSSDLFYNCSSLKGELIIPDSIKQIESSAFYRCEGLESLVLPSNLTDIGSNAFYECSGLNGQLIIPDMVEEIGSSAFSGCYRLTGELILSNSLTYLGSNAFYKCKNITSVVIPSGVATIENGVFSECVGLTSIDLGNVKTIKGGFNHTSLTNITIPSSVTSIESYAFGSSKIVQITNNSSVEIEVDYLDYGAEVSETGVFNNSLIKGDKYTTFTVGEEVFLMGFTDPTKETNANDIPSNITRITDYAFYALDKLSSVIIPSGVKEINNNAFSDCKELFSLQVSGSSNICNYAFARCRKLKNVDISPVKQIGEFAFLYCESLETINLENINSIQSDAFSGCANLKKVHIGKNLYHISEGALNSSNIEEIIVDENNNFYSSKFNGVETNTVIDILKSSTNNYTIIVGCKNSIIPNGITKINTHAFHGVKGLVSINIPESIVEIGSSAFAGCDDLKSIIIPNSVKSLGSQVFWGCTALESVVVSSGVTTLPYGLFEDCSSLTNVIIPDGITTIGRAAFIRCSALESIDIPSSVTVLEYNAFMSCNEIKSIIIPDTVTTLGYAVFDDWTAEQSIYFEGTSYPENLNENWKLGCYAKIYLNGVLQN